MMSFWSTKSLLFDKSDISVIYDTRILKNFLLEIPKEKQIRMLEDALKENKFNIGRKNI